MISKDECGGNSNWKFFEVRISKFSLKSWIQNHWVPLLYYCPAFFYFDQDMAEL